MNTEASGTWFSEEKLKRRKLLVAVLLEKKEENDAAREILSIIRNQFNRFYCITRRGTSSTGFPKAMICAMLSVCI